MAARVLGVIPAKARSRRAPGKNMRPIAGKPLIDYTFDAAKAARSLTTVCLTSEDPKILAHASQAGLETVTRDPEMSGDAVHASVPIIAALESLGGAEAFDYCVMLLPTFPLRTAATIDAVVGRAVDAADNVLSVSALGKTIHHLRTLTDDGRIRHVTEEKLTNFQSQDAPLLHTLNGICYCAPAKPLLRERSFHYGDPIGHVTDHIEAWDIDTEDDMRFAEFLLKARM